MRARLLLPLILALALPVILAPAPAAAARKQPVSRCLCAPPSFEDRFRLADGVFTGKITNIEIVQERAERNVADTPVKVTIDVDKGYKAVPDHVQFILNSNMNVNTCMGYKYETGKSYLFYVYMRRPETAEEWSLYDYPSGTYDVGGICGGTVPLNEAGTVPEIETIKEKLDDNPEAFGTKLKTVHGIIGVPTTASIAEVPLDQREQGLENGVTEERPRDRLR